MRNVFNIEIWKYGTDFSCVMMWDCEACKNKAVDGFINTLCLDCKRQYIGQEAEDYKPDRFEQREGVGNGGT